MLLLKAKNVKELNEITTNNDINVSNFKLDENYMYELTKSNSVKAQKCINENSRYTKTPSYQQYYDKQDKKLEEYTQKDFEKIIGLIATSNSTRTPKANIKILAKYISEKKDDFLKRLKSGEISLVDEITYLDGFTRREKSLASKVCCFLCELEYKKFNFSINDNVVRRILPYYLKYYDIPCESKNLDNCSYKEISASIEKIMNKLPEKMTYSEIDRIIWYCYKDDPVRSEVAIALSKQDVD